MANKAGMEALNNTLRDLRDDQRPMGGIIVMFAGDFRQILPVVPRGTKSDDINACLKTSYLWSNVQILKLTMNMRIILGTDGNAAIFSETVGYGTQQKKKCNNRNPSFV